MIDNMSLDQQNNLILKMEAEMEVLRTRAKLSQKSLSRMMGISRQTYTSIVTGKRHLSWRNYLALLFIFDNHKMTHDLLRMLDVFPTDFICELNGENRL